MIELRILGGVRLLVNDEPVSLEPRLRAVLAIAAIRGGRASFDELTRCFGTRSRATMRSYGAKLRACAGADVVKKNVRSAVELALGRDDVDLWRFHDKMAQAKGLPPYRKFPLVREATELWQGPPLWDLDQELVVEYTTDLRDAGRRAFLELIRLCLDQEGVDQAAVHADRASALFTNDDDVRLAAWGVWSRCGQDQKINDDLRRRERAGLASVALRAEAKRFADCARRSARVEPMALPHQLPPVRSVIHGRAADLVKLRDLTDQSSGVRAVTVCGLGGIGKTELAVTWAHPAVKYFPDGILFVDMLGFSPTGQLDAMVVLKAFARELGIAPKDVLSGSDALAAYRTAVNTRAVLVVLDNARDHAHVADLVAAGERSRTIITTRATVTAPVVAGGRILRLRPIALDAALDVLRESVGADRIDEARFSACDLMNACDGIPLAIQLVAAQARLSSGSSLKNLMARLGTPAGVLHAKPDGEMALRESLKLSYSPLSSDAAWVLQTIAIYPGPAIHRHVVSFLSGLGPHLVHEAVDELVRSSLLDPLSDDWFRLHDLVRAFALERAAEESPELEVAEVRTRLLGWLLASARRCDCALDSGRDLPDDLVVDEGAPLPNPVDETAATAWFDREQETLLAVLDSPDFRPFTAYRWRLPLALCCYYTRNGPWDTGERLLISACEISKDELDSQERTRYQAVCHRVLGNIQRKLGKLGVAEMNLQRSIALAESIAAPLDLANGHQQMGVLLEDIGRWETARDHATAAGSQYADLADERGIAATLPTEIHCHLELGEPERALGREAFAIEVMARAGTPYLQGALHRVLMSCHSALGQHAEAAAHGEAARTCYLNSNAPINEARLLHELAQTYRAVGRSEDEREALLSCVDIYERLGDKATQDRKVLAAAKSRLENMAFGGG